MPTLRSKRRTNAWMAKAPTSVHPVPCVRANRIGEDARTNGEHARCTRTKTKADRSSRPAHEATWSRYRRLFISRRAPPASKRKSEARSGSVLVGTAGSAPPPVVGRARTVFAGLVDKREMLVVLALLGSADVLPRAKVPPAPVCGTAFAGIGLAGATTMHCLAVGCF